MSRDPDYAMKLLLGHLKDLEGLHARLEKGHIALDRIAARVEECKRDIEAEREARQKRSHQ